jgi:hypothetical protein
MKQKNKPGHDWQINKDGALVLRVNGKSVGGVWPRAYKSSMSGQCYEGFLGAVWHPYRQVGRSSNAVAARHVVETHVAGIFTGELR